MPIAPYQGWALVCAGGNPKKRSLREPELGPVPSHPHRGDLCNCLLFGLFLSFFPLLSSSAQNTDSFTVSDA